jgi:hypothetical protein
MVRRINLDASHGYAIGGLNTDNPPPSAPARSTMSD